MESLTAEDHRSTHANPYQAIITFFANLFSYLFHPLFIPLYVTWYLVFVHHDFFAGYGKEARTWIMMRVGLNMVFFPAFTVFLLKRVGFIGSVFLKNQKDRIIPYMTSGIFYFWMYLVFRNQPDIPKILTAFAFGVFLTSSLALLANIYFKISMHALGCGGMVGLMTVVLNTSAAMPFTIPYMTAILVTGIVCTSRLLVSDHTQKDIYAGLIFGFFCQFISAAFLL